MSRVQVAAPARLHMGMFDLAGTLGRRFGGIGTAISWPQVIVEAAKSDELHVEASTDGPHVEKARLYAQRYLQANDIQTGASLSIRAHIPAHVGLGSGTKLALAVGQALATLYGKTTRAQGADPYLLAKQVGRSSRSAIGLWTFAQGGFVVEGGQWPDCEDSAPLLARYAMPASWRCVLAIPHTSPGLSGQKEHEAFQQLAPPREQAAAITHVVLMSLLPALVEERLPEFGAALTQLQQLVGESFSPIQGDRFANPLSGEMVATMLEWGAAGAGQSSWGPAVYGLVEGDEEGERLKEHVRKQLAGRGSVRLVKFDNDGVRVQYL